ncbi:MAG: N-acetylmuramoyl-L-alanine amidase [Clostridium celatum]|nr:N-acetylmuramoyl-L-alanine amidase [Clostridium celatum]MDU4980633.1 N-acetylmuramoyl-L-alanine amidase [Clostridium celatum]
MKIAVRGGHCPKVPGSIGILDELTEDRLVKTAVIKYLKQLGHEVLDVTPPDSTSTSAADLAYGVNKANEIGADLFVSIHFNKAFNSYNGALGSEVCVYSTYDIAQRVVNGLGELGFKNRGQKIRTELYELRNTSMKAMIVETCFVEATEDVALYKSLGPDTVGKKIAESIANKETHVTTPNNSSNDESSYRVKITANVLNVREGAGTNYYIVTTVKRNEVYTIVEESNGWGKLKSGEGWISLSYTIKL